MPYFRGWFFPCKSSPKPGFFFPQCVSLSIYVFPVARPTQPNLTQEWDSLTDRWFNRYSEFSIFIHFIYLIGCSEKNKYKYFSSLATYTIKLDFKAVQLYKTPSISDVQLKIKSSYNIPKGKTFSIYKILERCLEPQIKKARSFLSDFFYVCYFTAFNYLSSEGSFHHSVYRMDGCLRKNQGEGKAYVDLPIYCWNWIKFDSYYRNCIIFLISKVNATKLRLLLVKEFEMLLVKLNPTLL